jgi:phytoene synthase
MQPNYGSSAAAADIAACRDALRQGSRTFLAASLLLPRRVHEPAAALYAFCRLADDAVDIGPRDGSEVAGLRARLRRAYDGGPLAGPVDRALSVMVARHGIPIALPEALLEGFAWDAQGRRYEDFSDLADYAARVAGSVGAMMALLMGARTPDVVARACDLGVAMQLSNIARDVGEDARAGRLYLPLRWMRDAGIDPEAWLAEPVFSEALGGVVARVLREADVLYASARKGIGHLPRSCRPGIHAARLLYAQIGRQVARQGMDSVNTRAVVTPVRKVGVIVQSLIAAAWPRRPASLPTMEAVRFLVDAAATPVRGVPPKTMDDRIAWLVDLFARLDERRQVQS